MPLNGCMSPNGVLLCCTSSSNDVQSSISLHPVPTISGESTVSHPSWSTFSRTPDSDAPSPLLSLDLASTIYNRISPADIIHILAKPNVKLNYIIKALRDTMDLPPVVGPRGQWLREFSGICLEMYRTKAKHAQGPLLEELNGMWQTAHDMCSLSAYHAAFTDCKEGDVYDPSKPSLHPSHTDNICGSFVVISLRYSVATCWPDELGFGLFGTADERMRIIRRTASWHRRDKSGWG